MAALLRHGAARRLGGSVLQRTKAAVTSPAVAGERRRLVPRRMLSTKKRPREVVREIEQKKDELYDLIANTDATCKTVADIRLHLHLAAQITPRPHDFDWENRVFARRAYGSLKKVGILTLPFRVPYCWEYYRGDRDDKKVAPAMTRAEQYGEISPNF